MPALRALPGLRAALPMLVAAMMLAACATGLPVRTDVAADFDFTKARSFAFVSEDPILANRADPTISPLLEPPLRSAIAEAMTRRGYRQVPREEADLVVAFTLGSRERVNVDAWGPYGPAFQRHYWYYWDYPFIDIETYTESTLAIDLFDGRTKRPVWHGWTRLRSYGETFPAERLSEAVAAILAKFPYAL